jgi:hypothetical protein
MRRVIMRRLPYLAAGPLATLGLLAGLGLFSPAPVSGKEDKPAAVEVGKPAPEITADAVNVGTILPDKKDAASLSLKDVKGKNVVLFFFPKALTGG